MIEKKLFERNYDISPAQTPEEVIGYYARRIAQNLKLPSQFAALAPKIRDFFEYKAFGKKVSLYEPLVIKSMRIELSEYIVCNEFEKALQKVIIQETNPELLIPSRMLSETPPYPFSIKLCESNKTVFNYVACDNDFELEFAKFLHLAEDVLAFSKLPMQFGFSISYTDTRANIRHYFPDFVAKISESEYRIIETKGREDVEVQFKDRAARQWCENATELTGSKWKYLKVSQREFEKLRPDNFNEMFIAFADTPK